MELGYVEATLDMIRENRLKEELCLYFCINYINFIIFVNENN